MVATRSCEHRIPTHPGDWDFPSTLPPPIAVATYNGIKSSILEKSHGRPTHTKLFLAKYGLTDSDYQEMVMEGEAAELAYKSRARISLVGDYAIHGFPNQTGISLAKLVANQRFLQSRGINLEEPTMYTDWVYGWGRPTTTSHILIEKTFNRPNTQAEYDELWSNYYMVPGSRLFSIHGNSVIYSKNNHIFTGVSVVCLGELTDDPKVIAFSYEQGKENIGKRAGGLHIPAALVQKLVVPRVWNELPLFRGRFNKPLTLEEAEFIASLVDRDNLPDLPLRYAHKILYSNERLATAGSNSEEERIKIERGCMDLDSLEFYHES